jgi:type IV secretion system protein VirD4
MVEVYTSPTVLGLADEPNFDPDAFVRSGDTLFITSPGEMQALYGPLIVALVEAVRQAAYALHEEREREKRRAETFGTTPAPAPHVTFVLDEANSTAPIPLPAIIADAGGQSVHIVVGVQDLSRARERWGKGADGFLTLFPTKLIFPGVMEETTVNALSAASGEFDRVSTSHTRSLVNDRGRLVAVDTPSTSTTRQKVLTPGDISSIPAGQALRWTEGARWELVNVGFHWQDPYWTTLLDRSREQLYAAFADVIATDPTLAREVELQGFAVVDGVVRGFRDVMDAPAPLHCTDLEESK